MTIAISIFSLTLLQFFMTKVFFYKCAYIFINYIEMSIAYLVFNKQY